MIIDDAPLQSGDIVRIARGEAVELGPAANARIAASRAVVDRLVEGDTLIYGLNTGLGHMRNERMPREVIEASQQMTVRGHAGGIGPELPAEIVRAAMAVRLAGIARGGSGASPGIAVTYVGMLNAGVVPVTRLVGSIGASDLMHMADIALVAMGEGEATIDGQRLPGGEALRRAGIEPARLAAKDGLTLISANGIAIGWAALVVDRASLLADAADLVAAMSMEASSANPSMVDPIVAAAKPVAGQWVAAERIRRLLDGSRLADGAAGASVQDPLSFRVTPQVHGAYRETVRFATEAVDQELAAMDDNPLVAIDEDRMISNGNFHPMLLALAIDAIRPALVHVGLLSDRRAGQLWDALAGDANAFTPSAIEEMRRFGSPLLRYAGAARMAELRTLASPATLDVPVLDRSVEDHATNAPLAVRRTAEALDLAEAVLAVELLTASSSVGWREGMRVRMAYRTRAMLDRVAAAIAAAGPAPTSEAVHHSATLLLRGSLAEVADFDPVSPAGRQAPA